MGCAEKAQQKKRKRRPNLDLLDRHTHRTQDCSPLSVDMTVCKTALPVLLEGV